MNLQTERIENHQAQLTIEIEASQLEEAKRAAARRISRQVRIRGFRKGKAPYRLVAQTVGEGAIMEEAVGDLGDSLYKQALEESQVLPYGPGSFDDFKLEPAPTFVFIVPLQPEVELNDYQDVRVDFDKPEVRDEEVELGLAQLQTEAIEVLDAERQVTELGNRVLLAVDSEFLDGEEPDDNEPDDDEPATDDEDQALENEDSDDSDESEDSEDLRDAGWDKEDDLPYVPRKGETFVRDEDAVVILDPKEDPFIDGFVEAIVGAELGSDVVFELTIPDDDPDETIANRLVEFVVTVKQIEAIRIPEMDDDFAESACKRRGDEVTDLAGLRALIRQEMEKMVLEKARSEYSGQVLAQIVEGADIHYPEVMLDERIDQLIKDFEDSLQRQNLKLEDYLHHTGISREDLKLQHREAGTQSLKQSLVVMELIREEEVEASVEQVELRMEQIFFDMLQRFDWRHMLDLENMRSNVRHQLLISQVNERICAIGLGEDPDEAVSAYFTQMKQDVDRAKARQERLQAAEENEAEPDSDERDEASEAEQIAASASAEYEQID